MIIIFEEIFSENNIKINIEEYIKFYLDIFFSHKKKYDKIEKYHEYIFEEYTKIKKIEPELSRVEEYKLIIENYNFEEYNFNYKIQSLFIKYCLLEALKRLMEQEKKEKYIIEKCKIYKKTKFKYYPEISDFNNYEYFIKEISLRKEFGLHYIPDNNNTCTKDIFKLSPHQLFLKNVFSNNTPYNGILIFHGVGVGKTCSGVSIAENFKNLDNKIIILAPEKIQVGWKNNIYDPKKEGNQCTGNEYNYDEDMYGKSKDKIREKRVKEFYEMKGYLSFSNSVKNYLSEKTKHISKKDIIQRKQKEIELIKEKYSNKILIIDEVHNIRSEETGGERDTILYIEKVIKYSDNLKLILLTANPMFNQPEEIIWILNMLLMNDKRKTIKDKISFDKNNELTAESITLINENSKGYISYLRGENPTTFPYRLYPLNKEKILVNNKLDIFGNKLNKDNNLSFLNLYSSKLCGVQKKMYELETSKLENLENIDEVTYYGKLLQISNFIYPNDSDNIEDLYGSSGIKNTFNIKNKKPVKYSYKKNLSKDKINFLDLDHLDKYSCKIKSIIESINESDGIIFIYSNYLDGGIMPLVLALEQNGYIKYDKEEVLVSDKKRKLQSYKGGDYDPKNEKDYPGTYSVIAGDSLKLTNDFEKELSIATSKDNNEGQLIKIIIGSTVAAEGLDFKNIRCIHLMEPWHNINKLEQVIGRGIRNCSHSGLEKEFRNVTIYLHTCELDKKETIETYLYRKCEKKAKQIGQVEVLLKNMAIDKYLFQKANLIKEKDIEKIKINPSLRSKKDNSFYDKPFDKPFSRTCSFLDTTKLKNNISCDYLIDSNFIVNHEKIKSMNTQTFTVKYSQPIIDTYKIYISDIFLEFYFLEYSDLKSKIEEKINNFLIDIFNHALNQMINDKYTFEIKNTKGYIKFIDNYYLFQPINNEDIFLSLYYRLNRGIIDKNDYKLEIDNYDLPDIKEIEEYDWSNIYDKYEELINEDKIKQISKKDYSQIEIIFNLKDKKQDLFENKLKYEYIFDRLLFSEKRLLLQSIFEYIKEGNIEIKEKYNDLVYFLKEYLSPLFIYYNEEKSRYEWFNKYNKKDSDLFGYFIYWHERSEYYFFRYNSRKSILCNNIERENILNDFAEIDKNKIMNNKTYGFLTFSKDINYFNQNYIVLKVTKNNNKGKIIRSSALAELNTKNLINNFIKIEFPDIWPKIKNNIYDYNKLKISIMIEILLRKKQQFINGDLLWLYKY